MDSVDVIDRIELVSILDVSESTAELDLVDDGAICEEDSNVEWTLELLSDELVSSQGSVEVVI